MNTITIDKERCTRCESCVDVCVMRIYELADDSITLTDPSTCLYCGHCMAICPTDAIRVPVVSVDDFEPTLDAKALPDPDLLMGLFRRRRSVRRFQERPVEREKIERIIEAGRFAPTGANMQPFYFSVVQTPSVLKSIKKMMIDMFVQQAEHYAKALEEKIRQGEVLTDDEKMQQDSIGYMRELADTYRQGVDRMLWNAPVLISLHTPLDVTVSGVDAGLAGMQMALMAEVLGLGTCYIGMVCHAADALPEMKKPMHIPEKHTVPLAFVVGYPDFDYLRFVSRKTARINWA